MKLYKHPILNSEQLTDTEISQVISEVFSTSKEYIRQCIENSVNKRVPAISKNYTNLSDYIKRINQAIDSNDIFYDIEVGQRIYHGLGQINRWRVTVYIYFPIYLLCEYLFASGYSSSRIANNHSEDFYSFIISSNYQTLNTYVVVYDYTIDIDNITETELISYVERSFHKYLKDNIELLYDPELFTIKSEPAYDSHSDYGKFKNICNEFIKYCEATYKINRKSKWMNIVDKLESERDEDINSIYEQTEAGSYIDGIAQQVEKQIGIYGEPSTQSGHGIIEFRDINTDDILMTQDYKEYCEDVISMALNSNSVKGFKIHLEQYYYKMIE